MRNKLVATAWLLSSSLYADSFSFTVYNDFFAGHDEHFTSAASLIWLEDDQESNNIYSNILVSMLQGIAVPLDTSKQHNAGVNLEQMIVTPENTQFATAQYNDFPYAGYLSLSTFLLEWDHDSFIEYSAEFGVIGKESGAEFIQKTFHKIIGSEQPQGWDTQLSTRYTINVLLQHGVKSWEGHVFDRFESDWFNHYGVNLGTFDVSVFGGTVIRIGNNYIQNFNTHYPYLKSEANLLRCDRSEQHGFGWSVSAGLETKLLAYSAILDGAVSNGYETHKNVLNTLACFSASLYHNHHKMRLFYEIPTPYIEEQHKINIFGGLEYSYRF